MKITRVYYRIWLPDPKPPAKKSKRRASTYGTVSLQTKNDPREESSCARSGRLFAMVVVVPAALLLLLLHQRRKTSTPHSFDLAASDSVYIDPASFSSYWCQGIDIEGEKAIEVYQSEQRLQKESILYQIGNYSAMTGTEFKHSWSLNLPENSTLFVHVCLSGLIDAKLLVLHEMSSSEEHESLSELPVRDSSYIETKKSESPSQITSSKSENDLLLPKKFPNNLNQCNGNQDSSVLRYFNKKRGQNRFIVLTESDSRSEINLYFLLQFQQMKINTSRHICAGEAYCTITLGYGQSVPQLLVTQKETESRLSDWAREYRLESQCVPRTSVYTVCLTAAVASILIGAFTK